MSTVAWDGATLAADRRGVFSDMAITAGKLVKLEDGTLLAWVGSRDQGLALVEWYQAGAKPDAWPEWQKGDDWSRLIAVPPGGSLRYTEKLPVWQVCEDPFVAFGSGRDYAMGAMAMGAGAKQAVEVACRFDIYSGNGVEAFNAFTKD